MCNRCNSNASSQNTSCNCGCNSCGCGNGGWGNFWNSCYQSICRDCYGNIRVNDSGCHSCGCNSCVSSNNGCGCSDTSSSVYVFTGCNRASGGYALSGDDYYTRQYGLNACGYSNGYSNSYSNGYSNGYSRGARGGCGCVYGD